MTTLISKDFVNFSVDIGFDKFDLLKKHFGQDDDTGDLKGCSYNYRTGIATFSSKMLPFVYDCFIDGHLDTKCLHEVSNMITSFKVPINLDSEVI